MANSLGITRLFYKNNFSKTGTSDMMFLYNSARTYFIKDFWNLSVTIVHQMPGKKSGSEILEYLFESAWIYFD